MTRLRFNNIGDAAGTSNAITLTAAGTVVTWASDPQIPTIAAPDVLVLTVEPNTPQEEIITLTAHTAGTTTGTCVRNSEPTQGGANSSPAHTAKGWVHAPTVVDFSAPGALLGSTTFTPVADGTTYTIPNSTMVDADLGAGTLAVTFTAPSSGEVLIRLCGVMGYNINNNSYVGVREGSTVLATSFGPSTPITGRLSPEFLISGLTPGSVHTYKWAGNNLTLWGGPTYGSFVMSVFDAGVGQGSGQVPVRKVVHPTDGAATSSGTTFGAFTAAWETTVTTKTGNSVSVRVSGGFYASSDTTLAVGVAKDGVLVYTTGVIYNAGSGQRTETVTFEWVDDSPTTGSHTYAVWAAVSSGSAVTVRHAAPSTTIQNGTAGAEGTSSALVVEIFAEG